MAFLLFACTTNNVVFGHEKFPASDAKTFCVDNHQEFNQDLDSKFEPSLRNLYVCQTDKYFIRIDLLKNDELRYTCWNKPKNMEHEPDLTLVGGNSERQGTQGGIIYTFESGPWTYELDHVKVCPNDGGCGLFLTVYKNGKEVVRYEAEEIE